METSTSYFVLAEIPVAAIVLWTDLRRRRLTVAGALKGRLAALLDIVSPAVAAGMAGGFAAPLARGLISSRELRFQDVFGLCAYGAISVFLWQEGRRQLQFQRPRGLVFAEWFILAGITQAVGSTLFGEFLLLRRGPAPIALGALFVLIGGLTIARIVPPFVKKGSEYHRILEHHVEQGESVQQEYAAPTPECPNPSQWKMVDSQTTELEVLDFLKVLVTTLKPSLILETGTFLGYGTIKLAEGAKTNGFGRVVTVEYDAVIFAKARERIEAAGLSDWVECRNESSLETKIDGTIDFYFSDSALAIREQEIRRLLPQVSNHGLIAIHDASSQFEVVREAALRMEREGLLSVVLLSTPRGLVLAQKRPVRGVNCASHALK
jgi:predicted O-methyltransferase YrrM